MSNKKACILASVCSMIDQFNLPNIELLQSNGYEVHVVTNFENGSTTSQERVNQVRQMLEDQGVKTIHMPIPRSIFSFKGILNSLAQMKRLCKENTYELIHCHSPIGGVIARLGGRKSRKAHDTKMIYTAHGFHFYKGAPKQNWLIFYPIEWICSFFTDVLITINTEDYAFAKKHMKAGKVEYVPGIGIDMEKFYIEGFDANKKKAELGLQPDDVMVISVGELNHNKNQEVIIRAIGKLGNPKIHYFIAGRGEKTESLKELAIELGVNIHPLGYRSDIIEILNGSDIFAFPSYREGLSVALMEAMAAGLPCVVSKIRGNADLVDEQGGVLCAPNDVEAFANGINTILQGDRYKRMSEHNRKVIVDYDTKIVNDMMKNIYGLEEKRP